MATPPLSPEKRVWLAGLLLDSRFDPLWKEWILDPNDDLCREFAIKALRAHAGREVLPDWEFKKLFTPENKTTAPQEIRKIIEESLRLPSSG